MVGSVYINKGGFMNDLAFIERNNVLCDSRVIADKFSNGKHARVKDVIKKLIGDLSKIKGKRGLPLNDKYSPLFIEKENVYRNQSFTYYLLNKTAFTLVSMRFKTEEALIWQIRFAETFQKMEEALLNQKNTEWIASREQGKEVLKIRSDAIKEFTVYATSQGSKNAKFYYKHITNATYKALELIQHKKPKLRDTLDILELSQLMTAEIVAERSIRKWMAEGEHYKTVFTLVKKDIEAFANTLFLTHDQKGG